MQWDALQVLALLFCSRALRLPRPFKPPQDQFMMTTGAAFSRSSDAGRRTMRVHCMSLHPGRRPAAAKKGDQEAKEPTDRIGTANDRRPDRAAAGQDISTAVQVFPYSPGALYQIYASPGQITDIALEPGEQANRIRGRSPPADHRGAGIVG